MAGVLVVTIGVPAGCLMLVSSHRHRAGGLLEVLGPLRGVLLVLSLVIQCGIAIR